LGFDGGLGGSERGVHAEAGAGTGERLEAGGTGRVDAAEMGSVAEGDPEADVHTRPGGE
jgi:hypothetical protein